MHGTQKNSIIDPAEHLTTINALTFKNLPLFHPHSIMNTMTTIQKSAQSLLHGTGLSLLDAARLICQIMDGKPKDCLQTAAAYCTRVIQAGLAQQHIKPQKLEAGFALYLASKQHLRPDSRRDIRYLGSRLLRTRPDLAQRTFDDFSLSDCEQWLEDTFTTPSQFNKGRTLLHALFQFACCREWCSRNPLRYLAKKRVVEQEIVPLQLEQTQHIIAESHRQYSGACAPAVALLLWAGLRPTELQRIRWGDIDLAEKSITIRSVCSKTGGVRQVDICRPLLACLKRHARAAHHAITPPNWPSKWKNIRDAAGFKGCWVQDVLRHTYASYHAKRFKNLALLQLNMGHRDQSLLRARYVNMKGISQTNALAYFSACFKVPLTLV